MKLGNNKFYLIILFSFLFNTFSFSEEKIFSSPLINLDKIKPSFEEVDEKNINSIKKEIIKKKKKNLIEQNLSNAKIFGLDKITAKIIFKIGRTVRPFK